MTHNPNGQLLAETTHVTQYVFEAVIYWCKSYSRVSRHSIGCRFGVVAPSEELIGQLTTEPNDAFYIPIGDGQVRVAEPNELHLNNLQLCIDSGLGSVYQLEHQWDNCHLHTGVWKYHFGIFGWFGVHVPSYSYICRHVTNILISISLSFGQIR